MTSKESSSLVDPEYVPLSLDVDKILGRVVDGADGRRLRLVLIGAGAMGAEHVETTHAVGQADIVGVFDPNPNSVEFTLRRAADSSGVKIFDSLEAAAADESVDGYIVATPNHTHWEVVQTLMTSGKPLLLEKPMAANLEDAVAITEAAAAYSAAIFLGLEYRYKPYLQELVYEVHERRTAGDVRMVTIIEHRCPFLNKWKQWNKFSEFSGGTLVEKCCHYFDLFNLLTGSRPARVFASGAQDVAYKDFVYEGRRSDIIDNAYVIVEFESGARACLDLCMFLPHGCREHISVSGSHATIYGYDNPNERLEVVAASGQLDRTVKPRARANIAGTGSHSGSTFYEHVEFYRCIRDGTPPPVTVLDGLWSMVIGLMAEESIREKRPIELPDVMRRFR
jgi:myo-inositol 2-dehydrogenase / D-chiro-inositol 1-dehydrogenase